MPRSRAHITRPLRRYHADSVCLLSRYLHPARPRHFASPAAAPATTSSSSSPHITLSPAQSSDEDWEGRYNALKAQRQAAAITRWEELQSEFPDVDFPSPDGAERPSKRVVQVASRLFQLTLLESFQLARLMDDTYGFSAQDGAASAQQPNGAQAAAGGAAPAAAEKKEEVKAEAKTAFSVRLDGFGAADKIKVIKEVRTATGLGLKESKELVEGAPKVIKKDLNKADCDALVAKLKEAGAKVTVE